MSQSFAKPGQAGGFRPKPGQQITTNKATGRYPIIVSQYERDVYSVDNPEQLHWAIIVLVNLKEQKGPCWQATDRHYRDGRVKWTMSIIDEVMLGNTNKCLGGVCIGYVDPDRLDDLKKVRCMLVHIIAAVLIAKAIDCHLQHPHCQIPSMELSRLGR